MKSYTVFLRFILVATILSKGFSTVQAQSGDQILDGIGETGMIARYVFNGDLKDWSRNNLHATAGHHATFINDKRFGKVLSLSGEKNDFIQIPAEALTDMESLSISGWLYLRSEKKGQVFFDFGKDGLKHFFAAPFGTSMHAGFQSVITTGKK
jgi:hypothetical protein